MRRLYRHRRLERTRKEILIPSIKVAIFFGSRTRDSINVPLITAQHVIRLIEFHIAPIHFPFFSLLQAVAISIKVHQVLHCPALPDSRNRRYWHRLGTFLLIHHPTARGITIKKIAPADNNDPIQTGRHGTSFHFISFIFHVFLVVEAPKAGN